MYSTFAKTLEFVIIYSGPKQQIQIKDVLHRRMVWYSEKVVILNDLPTPPTSYLVPLCTYCRYVIWWPKSPWYTFELIIKVWFHLREQQIHFLMTQLLNKCARNGWPRKSFVPGTQLPLNKTQMIKLHVCLLLLYYNMKFNCISCLLLHKFVTVMITVKICSHL